MSKKQSVFKNYPRAFWIVFASIGFMTVVLLFLYDKFVLGTQKQN